jgi:hypothetical protein
MPNGVSKGSGLGMSTSRHVSTHSVVVAQPIKVALRVLREGESGTSPIDSGGGVGFERFLTGGGDEVTSRNILHRSKIGRDNAGEDMCDGSHGGSRVSGYDDEQLS